MRSDLGPAIGIKNGTFIGIIFWLCMWLLMGCGTYTPQVIKWNGDKRK